MNLDTQSQTPENIEALKLRYDELTSCMWNALNMYFKASSLALAVVSVALGYLFKVPLPKDHGRIVGLVVVLMLILGYTCSGWGLKFYRTVLKHMKDTAGLCLSRSIPINMLYARWPSSPR